MFESRATNNLEPDAGAAGGINRAPESRNGTIKPEIVKQRRNAGRYWHFAR